MTGIPTLSDLKMKHDPMGRGYHAVYREQEVNHCPGCGRVHAVAVMNDRGTAVGMHACFREW